MIKSFRSRETEQLFNRIHPRHLPHHIHETGMRKLWMLDAATDVHELRIPPSNHLEKLSGRRDGQYSIRINEQWRVCFMWREGNAYEVKIIDYH